MVQNWERLWQWHFSKGTAVITGGRQAELDTAVKELGDDASNLEDVDRLYAAVADNGRSVDVLFANAAIRGAARISEITEEQLDYQLGVDFKGVVFTVQKALPRERPRLHTHRRRVGVQTRSLAVRGDQ